MTYKYKQKVLRMKLATYNKIRKEFPPLNRNESVSDYFERLSKYLSDVQIELERELLINR
jgi:hypothetical protein